MDIFPKCEVCHERFNLKGPSPYLLPCLHAVCDTCVTSTAGGVISCSTCQREVDLTETHLQKDLVRQREIFHLTVQHRPAELLCTHEDDGNQAVCWCQECEEFLCEYCQTLHESVKATRRHDVQEIGDIQSEKVTQEHFCNVHKSCPLDLWDRTCNIPICSRCRRGDHAEHDVEDVDTAADTAKRDIEKDKEDVLKIMDCHKYLLESTGEHVKLTEDTANIVRDNIRHTFQSLRSSLDQREKELVIETDRPEETNAELYVNITAFKSSYIGCETASEYINKALLFSSKYDLLKLKNTIRETTQKCVSPATLEQQNLVPFQDFSTSGLEKLKSDISSFGKIAAAESEVPSREVSQQDMDTHLQAEDTTYSVDVQSQHGKEMESLVGEISTLRERIKQFETLVATLTRGKKETVQEARCMKEHSEMILSALQKHGLYFLETVPCVFQWNKNVSLLHNCLCISAIDIRGIVTHAETR